MLQNPIANDPVLKDLLNKSNTIESPEDFDGWRNSFLKTYTNYLDEAGVENAHDAEGRLLNSLKKLSKTVLNVQEQVDLGNVSAERVGVQGQRFLTNMTDQMSESEKALKEFLPETNRDEEQVGYNKFELGAVLIQDGFEVYEILKGTQTVINDLQTRVLKDVTSSDAQSKINYYLRQIQSFCDVMADLGLFGLMQQITEMYKIRPRSKRLQPAMVMAKKGKSMSNVNAEIPERPQPEKSKSENLKKNKNFRAIIDNGYVNPFTGEGTQSVPNSPTPKNNNKKKKYDSPDPPADDDGEGDNEEIIYFDVKTGKIGRIPRSVCKGVFIKDNGGEETFDGEVTDDNEKEQLIWALKKGMKKTPAPKKNIPKKSLSRPDKIKKETEACSTMSLKDLKQECANRGVDTIGFCEKSEFINAVAEARVDKKLVKKRASVKGQ